MPAISFLVSFCFFFNDTATTEIYTLSLHDALPICGGGGPGIGYGAGGGKSVSRRFRSRSEEHTSELQSHSDLVCRLLLEKKKASISFCAYTWSFVLWREVAD